MYHCHLSNPIGRVEVVSHFCWWCVNIWGINLILSPCIEPLVYVCVHLCLVKCCMMMKDWVILPWFSIVWGGICEVLDISSGWGNYMVVHDAITIIIFAVAIGILFRWYLRQEKHYFYLIKLFHPAFGKWRVYCHSIFLFKRVWWCYDSHGLFTFLLTLTPLWLTLPTLMTCHSHTHSTLTHQPLLYFYYIYS